MKESYHSEKAFVSLVLEDLKNFEGSDSQQHKKSWLMESIVD